MVKLKKNDKVYTSKGKRNLKNPGMLVITETGRKWKEYDAVICRRRDGSTHLYLTQNLYKKTPRKIKQK